MLARLGNTDDIAMVFSHAVKKGDIALLTILGEGRVTPRPPFEEGLRQLLAVESPDQRLAAFRLAGLWKATALAPEAMRVSLDSTTAVPLRAAAMNTLARLDAKGATAALSPLMTAKETPLDLRRAAIESLSVADLPNAAASVAGMIGDTSGKEVALSLLPTLLTASGGPAALAAVFESGTAPDSATAQEILNAMNRLGRTDAKLTPLLNQAIGRQSGAPDYDPSRVAAVVSAIREGKGDGKRGAEVYRLAQLACTACHQIGDEGGVIGPALNGVGAGMPLDQIVESILWPNRQIKEGFQAVAFTTTAGASITGYVERESDDIVWYRDTGTPWIKPLAKKDIASREVIPTLMPPHLTASLTDEQFLDLVAFLASLKG